MQKTVKTRSGRVLQLPTAEEDTAISAAAHADTDAAPFTDAEWEQVKPLARRGRPLGSGTKVQITMRIDAEVLNTFKATGPGWQSRINEVLRSWVKNHA